jgi:phosphate starvation-inducible membrane PsiE
MMKKHADTIRPFLFSVRLLLWFCAVITLALTAWVVDHLKGYRAVFPLVIAVLTTAFYIPSLFTAGMRRNRGYMIPLDIVFYALYFRPFSLITP